MQEEGAFKGSERGNSCNKGKEKGQELISEPNRTNEIQLNRSKNYLENRKLRIQPFSLLGPKSNKWLKKKEAKLT